MIRQPASMLTCLHHVPDGSVAMLSANVSKGVMAFHFHFPLQMTILRDALEHGVQHVFVCVCVCVYICVYIYIYVLLLV